MFFVIDETLSINTYISTEQIQGSFLVISHLPDQKRASFPVWLTKNNEETRLFLAKKCCFHYPLVKTFHRSRQGSIQTKRKKKSFARLRHVIEKKLKIPNETNETNIFLFDVFIIQHEDFKMVSSRVLVSLKPSQI